MQIFFLHLSDIKRIKMKSNFTYIVFAIIGSLFIVFLVQLVWLRDLYQTIKTETEKTVQETLNMADTYELEFRLDSLDRTPKDEGASGEISISQSIGSKSDDENGNQLIQQKRVVQGGDTIQDVKEVEDNKFSLTEMNRMFDMVKVSVHQTIDRVAPIRLDMVYSYLSSTFLARNIHSEIYRIETVNFDTDSILQSKSLIELIPSSAVFTYIYDTDNNLGYRIFIQPLTRTVLFQMLGILSTTLLIVLILGFAFWFLIRTIFQQKTLEEMKEDFTNNMTHELKTPLAVAYSATDALLNFGQGENKEKREKYLTICKEQLEKLSGLVEQILSMSMERRLRFVLKKEHTGIKQLIDALIPQHRMKTNREVEFHVDISPEDLTVYADKTHLNNVLSNLIDNAIKYSTGKAVIGINIRKETDTVIISVIDNGIGIPTDKQKFIFDKFYRVPQGNKHDAKGYGIGLFYVKTIVEKHGGTIAVESTVGKGSVFTIKLPVE